MTAYQCIQHHEKANLDMIQVHEKNYKSAIIGYSDHTLGIKACDTLH